jgi:hypothetical protein
MTDPTTLSAAELDEIANREVCFTNGIGWRIVLTAEECDALVAQARRTEAAEREVDRLKDYIGKLHAGFVALREDSDPCGETFMFSEAANALFDRITQFSLTDTEKG